MLNKNHRSLLAYLGLILVLFGGMLGASPIQPVLASTLTVTNANDSGSGSLRLAISSASSGDTIIFHPSLAGQTIILTSQLDINKNLVIDGSGLSPRISISGNNLVRIFNIGSSRTVTLRSLILKNGYMNGSSYTSYGGAIYTNTYSVLKIEKVLFMGNVAYQGGAVYVSSLASATILESEFSANVAQSLGGGISARNSLTIKNSLFENNVSNGAGGAVTLDSPGTFLVENSSFVDNHAGSAGAIALDHGQNFIVTIRNNLFSGNIASGAGNVGGAIRTVYGGPIPILVENNTFYSNQAQDVGGALATEGSIILRNNTFSKNQANRAGGNGGGSIYFDGGGGTLYNNIFADNIGGGECTYSGPYMRTTGSNNLVEDGSPVCLPTLTGDPFLNPLGDNGGPTQTMAINAGSPALDAGDDSTCSSTDQRGTPRPQGIACDLGAVERDVTSPAVTSSFPVDGGVLIADNPKLLTIAFNEPMNQYVNAGKVTDPSNYLLINDNGDGFQTISCVAGSAVGDQSVSINGVSYNRATFTSSLDVNGEVPLPVGYYRLFVCGTTPALTDVTGNSLNHGSADTVISFRVIAISGNSIPENQPIGTNVFTLTTPDGSNFSYDLDGNVVGCNGADNTSFAFNSNQLITTAPFDHEAKNIYTICVTIIEAGGDSFSQELAINVVNVNESPLDIGLSNNAVNENLPVAAQVGILYTQDPDANSSFTYTLAEGLPDCSGLDNGSFTITGNVLRTNVAFDYETKASYSICVRSTDSGSLSVDKQFTIAVLNTNDAPNDVILTPSSILEDQPGNTLVGYLIAIDPDGPTTTSFSSIPGKEGCWSTGFNWFVLSNGNEIRALAPLDYEGASSYTLCVRATDSLGAAFEEQLTITVISTTFPTAISITRVDENPSSAVSVDYQVTFSEPVTGVDAGDFTLTTNGVLGAMITDVIGSSTTYTVTVNTGTGTGTLRLDVVDDDSIVDGSSNPLGGIGAGNGDFTSGETYEVIKMLIFSASFETNDGWILESSETSSVGGTLNRTATTLRVGDDATNQQYRALLSFDTPALPEGAVITSVTLQFKYQGKTGTLPFSTHGKLLADICKGTFKNNPALQLGDFNARCPTGFYKVKALIYSNTSAENWYSQSLLPDDFQFINFDGVTQFRLRFTKDDNNDFGADFLKLFSGNAAEADRPQLVIEYYVP